MKAVCRYSGIPYRTEYFPFTLTNSILHHPVFDIPFPELLQLAEKWNTPAFTDIDRRLYFLALLRSTDLIEWRTYARPTDRIIAANMDSMIEWAGLIHGIKSKEAFTCLPHYVVSHATSGLENIDGWFSTWADAMAEYKDQYRTYNAAQLQIRREHNLERLIKDPNRTTESYASLLAEWAAVAASFPTGLVPNPFKAGESITLCDYWKSLLRLCGSKTFQLWKLDRTDMRDLLDHLELSLPHGSLTAFETLQLLRNAIARHDSILGTGVFSGPSFTLMDDNDSVEKANILAAASKAPMVKPVLEDYPSKVAFLRAKAKWDLAQLVQDARQESSGSTGSNINVEDL